MPGGDVRITMKRHWKKIVGGVVVLIVALFAAVFIYAKFINKADAALTKDDLNKKLTSTSIASTTDPATTGSPTSGSTTANAPASSAAPGTAAPTAAQGLDGVWKATAESEFGYRVQEVLTGIDTTATGRSHTIDGSITVAGTTVSAAEFTVDVASIKSDEERRNRQFAGKIMETSQFPNATFKITAPIELGTMPAVGTQATYKVTGDLTLHGVTKSVTVDLTTQQTGTKVGVQGNIPIVFADYNIANPSISGFVTTEDKGLLEFVLVFERA
jgi:polyisoprenoid-binding protein YceI